MPEFVTLAANVPESVSHLGFQDEFTGDPTRNSSASNGGTTNKRASSGTVQRYLRQSGHSGHWRQAHAV